MATCAGFYAAEYLKARSLPAEGLRLKVVADQATQPARLGRFQIEVTAPGIESQHQAVILWAVKSCLIHNTLLSIPAIDIVVNAPVAVAA